MEHGGQRDTAVDEPTTGTPVDSLDVATAAHEVSTKDASAESSALVSLPGQPRRSPRRWLASSLAWSALLIAGVQIGGGLLLERAAYGCSGIWALPPHQSSDQRTARSPTGSSIGTLVTTLKSPATATCQASPDFRPSTRCIPTWHAP